MHILRWHTNAHSHTYARAHTRRQKCIPAHTHTHTQAYTYVRGPAHAYVLKMAGGASVPPVTQLCRVQGLSDPRLSPLLDEEVEPWSWRAPHRPLQAAHIPLKVRFTPLVQLPTCKGSSWEGRRDEQLWSWRPLAAPGWSCASWAEGRDSLKVKQAA